MARSDVVGFFWDDTPIPKAPKAEKVKRLPPERTWERADYLPNLEEARQFKVEQFTDLELLQASRNRERLVFDVECYANYFIVAFQSITTGKITYVEQYDGFNLDCSKLKWLLSNFTIVSFNGNNYDLPIIALALAGKTNEQLKYATYEIIVNGTRPSDVLKSFKVKSIKPDHIDLIEVAPLRASLKIYSGRLHAKRMQDLPFHPDVLLSRDQRDIVRWYCVNDLVNTGTLYNALTEQLTLREKMSAEYKLDLRSRSDAQIAEAVICEELERLNGCRAQRPAIDVGTAYRYHVPNFLRFFTPLMQWALTLVANAQFIVSEEGGVGMPPELKELGINIGKGVYRMGIGGLHSSEEQADHIADANTILVDRDVTSYYPQIILNQQLYPKHLGRNFLQVYQGLVNRRLAAKRNGNKVVADSLKITINGSYGKLGSKYSALYAPDLLIQTTLTGQLSLLMLIERLELSGIPVVSANTDGIVIKCPISRKQELDALIGAWEHETQFTTEETSYVAMYSRDVNNYIAIKPDGKAKTKGAYAAATLSKNPTGQICVDAVLDLLTKRVPLHKTITECTDIRKFVNVRNVKGGAVKDGVYLGKSIRWYYAIDEATEIVYALNGNKVPRSDGAKPLMDLPAEFPQDVNYNWYIQEAEKILLEIGYMRVTT